MSIGYRVCTEKEFFMSYLKATTFFSSIIGHTNVIVLETSTLGRAATRLSVLTACIHAFTAVLDPVLHHRKFAWQPIFAGGVIITHIMCLVV